MDADQTGEQFEGGWGGGGGKRDLQKGFGCPWKNCGGVKKDRPVREPVGSTTQETMKTKTNKTTIHTLLFFGKTESGTPYMS